MMRATLDGFRAVLTNPGLVVLVLVTNLLLAMLLAVPLAGLLEHDLAATDSASQMLYGADAAWWDRFNENHRGWASSFTPAIAGSGFVFRNLELLLSGHLPGGLFAQSGAPGSVRGLDPLILGLGICYLIIQTFLAGGILAVFREPRSGWTLRGLLHGSGFYFGRLFRVALLALFAAWVTFRVNAPLARWVDRQALESVSETTALIWSFSRYAALLAVLVFVHMVSSFAKVIVVLEERSSAALAVLSSLSFCLRFLGRATTQYLIMLTAGGLLLGVFGVVDSAWTISGYKTQIMGLLLAQGLVAGQIGLRLALLAGQMVLYRTLEAP